MVKPISAKLDESMELFANKAECSQEVNRRIGEAYSIQFPWESGGATSPQIRECHFVSNHNFDLPFRTSHSKKKYMKYFAEIAEILRAIPNHNFFGDWVFIIKSTVKL